MSRESVQTATDLVFKAKMPLFEGTGASMGLSKPQPLSGFPGKQTLHYNGTYLSYEGQGKEDPGFAPPWNSSKTSPLDGRSPVGHLSGMDGHNHMIYRQVSTSPKETHSSSLHHSSKQGFISYSRSREISSPSVATSETIREQKTGAENSSPSPQSSLYLAIPKPVYGHNPCCNELGCVMGQQYGLEHVPHRMPNTIYEHDWMQRAPHYTEKAPIQRKDLLLQQRGLQYECGPEQIKRMSLESFSPSHARTLPSVIEPNYSIYPTRSLYGSLNEHSQTSPRGYPSLYASRPTYEHLTSEVYQERSPMPKYGQLAQHPVFYYSHANGEAENRTQCKESGSKQGEDVPLLNKHREHYVSPQWLHQEYPLTCTEILPNPSFVRGFDYSCYAVPRINLNGGRTPLTRQHSTAMFHSTHINASKSSQPINPSPMKDKPRTSLLFEQLHGSSSFPSEKSKLVKHVNQSALSSSTMQIGRLFHPLSSLHIDKPVPQPAALNMDGFIDSSPCENKAKHPKKSSVSPTIFKSQQSAQSSNQIPAVVHNGASIRKIIHSPTSKHRALVSNAESNVLERHRKRNISHLSSAIRIKVENEHPYTVETPSKQSKLDNETIEKNAKNDSPPMPVIDNVFSLALHQPQDSVVSHPNKLPEKSPPSSEKQVNREKMPDPNNHLSVICHASKEMSVVSPAHNRVTDVFEPKKIKVEKVDPASDDTLADTKTDFCKVIIKQEPEETSPSDSVSEEQCEPDKLENKLSISSQENKSSTFEKLKPSELPSQINSSNQVDTQPKLSETLQPTGHTLQQSSETKRTFTNIPLHCLKLSTYNIIIPQGKQCKVPSPPAEQFPQPVNVPVSISLPPPETQTPVRKHFLELHHCLCKLISKCVSASLEQDLRGWLSQLKMGELVPQSNKTHKVACLLGEKARAMWLNEDMQFALANVHKRLREYAFQKRCPFPHVMRTGAVFIPMLVVKELLFPMVQGSFIDQVLQEHKVQLRPTTLSEEKILIQLHKQACSSRLRRLMSLKHLPDIYNDVINLLYYTYVCKHLGINADPGSGEVQSFEESNLTETLFLSNAASPPSQSPQHMGQEVKPDVSMHGTKDSVKSSSGHASPDDLDSNEDETADVEKMEIDDVPSTSVEKNTDGCSGSDEETNTDSSTVSQGTHSEDSWVCPLTSDTQSPSSSDTEPEVLSASKSVRPQVKGKSSSGVILKLRKMFSKGHNIKKACYQSVSPPGIFSDSSSSHGDRESMRITGDSNRTFQLNQKKGSSHALIPINSPSKRNVRSLLKIKYCPYLATCHSGERRRRWVLRSAVQRARSTMRLFYPDLVGKKIRHLYEEDDKSEVWYTGEVLRVHETHPNPLKTIFEVKYDSEPEWKYYLELLVDYKKGWLKIDD